MKKIIFSIVAITMSATAVVAQTAKFNPVAKSTKTAEGQVDTYKDGTSKTFEATTSSEVSLLRMDSVLNGDLVAYKPSYRKADGTMNHAVSTSLGGGALLTTESKLHPVIRGELGYTTCHWLFGIGASLSQGDYSATATTTKNSYNVLRVSGNVAWKFMQNSVKRDYVAVGVAVGYGYQATDAEEERAHSNNYGFEGGAFIEGYKSLNYNWGLSARAGYDILARNNHNDKQNLGYGGAYLLISAKVYFRQKPAKAVR